CRHDIARERHGIRARPPGLEHAVLGLDPHDPTRRRARAHRYWPVFDTVSMVRAVDEPFLPVTIVRMKTMRSPFLPETRAQSSGLVVLGRSSFSLNSSTHAVSRCSTRRPR